MYLALSFRAFKSPRSKHFTTERFNVFYKKKVTWLLGYSVTLLGFCVSYILIYI